MKFGGKPIQTSEIKLFDQHLHKRKMIAQTKETRKMIDINRVH